MKRFIFGWGDLGSVPLVAAPDDSRFSNYEDLAMGLGIIGGIPHVWDPSWLALWRLYERRAWLTGWGPLHSSQVSQDLCLAMEPCGPGALSRGWIDISVISIPGAIKCNWESVRTKWKKRHRTQWRIFPVNHVWLPEVIHKRREFSECLKPEDHDIILEMKDCSKLASAIYALSWSSIGNAAQVYTARGIGLPISRRTLRPQPWGNGPITPRFVGSARNVKFWTALLERCRPEATIQARFWGFLKGNTCGFWVCLMFQYVSINMPWGRWWWTRGS